MLHFLIIQGCTGLNQAKNQSVNYIYSLRSVIDSTPQTFFSISKLLVVAEVACVKVKEKKSIICNSDYYLGTIKTMVITLLQKIK